MENTDIQSGWTRSDITSRMHRAPRTPRTSRVSRPYRTSRTGRTANKSKYSFKEKLLLQCIICGVFLAVIMFTSLVNTGFSNRITGWIGAKISENTNITAFQSDGGGATGLFNAVKTIFGYEGAVPAEETGDMLEIDNAVRSEEPNLDNAIEIGTDTITENEKDAVDVIRVDENMLDELNSVEDIYNQKN